MAACDIAGHSVLGHMRYVGTVIGPTPHSSFRAGVRGRMGGRDSLITIGAIDSLYAIAILFSKVVSRRRLRSSCHGHIELQLEQQRIGGWWW